MERIKVSPEYLEVVRCNKVCRGCDKRWQGLYFRGWIKRAAKLWVTRVPLKAKAYVRAWCNECIEKWERASLRRNLEGDVGSLDDLLRVAPSKGKRILLMRRKANVLAKIRDTYDSMSSGWCEYTDKLRALQDTIGKMQNGK